MKLPILLRQPSKEDVPFIANSWLKSHRDGSVYTRHIPATTYFKNYEAMVNKLIKRSNVLVACNAEDPEQIFGYGLFETYSFGPTVVHYLYVKQTYRRLGVGTYIFDAIKAASGYDPSKRDNRLIATHETQVFRETLRIKWDIIFNPFLIWIEIDDPTNIGNQVSELNSSR